MRVNLGSWGLMECVGGGVWWFWCKGWCVKVVGIIGVDFERILSGFGWIVFELRFEEFCVGEGARGRRLCERFNNMTRYPPRVSYTVRFIGINRLIQLFVNLLHCIKLSLMLFHIVHYSTNFMNWSIVYKQLYRASIYRGSMY